MLICKHGIVRNGRLFWQFVRPARFPYGLVLWPEGKGFYEATLGYLYHSRDLVWFIRFLLSWFYFQCRGAKLLKPYRGDYLVSTEYWHMAGASRPLAIYETKISRSRVLSGLAGSSVWSISLVAYYLTNAVQLAFIGIPTRPELHISNHNAPFFWSNWKSILLYDVGGAIVEWIGFAVVGGFIVGFLVSSICLLNKRMTMNQI